MRVVPVNWTDDVFLSPVTLTQPGIPKLDPLLDPHCYEGVEVF